jgi:hypothetical protein
MLEPRIVATSVNRLFEPDTPRLAETGAAAPADWLAAGDPPGAVAGLIEGGDAWDRCPRRSLITRDWAHSSRLSRTRAYGATAAPI